MLLYAQCVCLHDPLPPLLSGGSHTIDKDLATVLPTADTSRKMSDELGYAVEHGQGGFFGGVGGPREPLKGHKLYTELSKLVEPGEDEIFKGHMKVGMRTDKDLRTWWSVVESMFAYKDIDPRWTLHRGWWTLGELRRALNTKDLFSTDVPTKKPASKKAQNSTSVASDSGSSKSRTALHPENQNQDCAAVQKKGVDSCQKCDECGKIGQGHAGPVHWISCYNCGRWYVEDCLSKNGKRVPHKLRKCGRCYTAHKRLEQMVSEWEEMKVGMHNIEKRLASLEGSLQKVQTEVRQDGRLDCGKMKEADKKCTMTGERLRQMANEIEKLRRDCWQAKEERDILKDSEQAKLKQKDAEVQEARRAIQNEREETRKLKRKLEDAEGQLRRTQRLLPVSLQEEVALWARDDESMASHCDLLWRETGRFLQDTRTVDCGPQGSHLSPWLHEIRDQTSRSPQQQESFSPSPWHRPSRGSLTKQQQEVETRLHMEKAAQEEALRKRVAMVQEELEIVKKRRKWNRQGQGELEEGEVERPLNRELDWTTLHDVQVMEDLEKKGGRDDALPDDILKHVPEYQQNMWGILGKQILFVGDNFIIPIAKDTGLEATALERGWDVTFKYGALAFEAYDLLRDQENMIGQYRWVVLSAGSNTIKNAPHSNLKELDSYLARLVVQPLHEAVKLCLHNDTKIVLLIPPPRRDLEEWIRCRAVSQIDKQILQEGGCTFHMDLEHETADQYIARLLPDGVNFRESHFREVLVRLLQFLGEDPELRPPEYKLSVQVCCRNFCKSCGGPIRNVHGIPSHQHVKFEACHICDDPKHATNVCLYCFKMCLKCGRRGHKASKCWTHTR